MNTYSMHYYFSGLFKKSFVQAASDSPLCKCCIKIKIGHPLILAGVSALVVECLIILDMKHI